MNHRRLLIIMAVVALSEQTLITKLIGLKVLKKYALSEPHVKNPPTEIIIEYPEPNQPVVQDNPYPPPANPPTHYGPPSTPPPPPTTLPPLVVTTTEPPATNPPYVPHETYGIPTHPPVVPHETYGPPTVPPVHVQPTEPEPVDPTTTHPPEDCPETKLQANLYQLDTTFGGNSQTGQVHLYPAVPVSHTGSDVVTSWHTGPVNPSEVHVEDPKQHFLGTPFEKVVETPNQYVQGLTVPYAQRAGSDGFGMVWGSPSGQVQPAVVYGAPY